MADYIQGEEKEQEPMATYARATYNAGRYAAARPTYPTALTDLVLTYHARGPAALNALRSKSEVESLDSLSNLVSLEAAKAIKDKAGAWDTAVDLGCGTGQATGILRPFKHAIAADPSSTMLEGATKNVINERFPVSSAFSAAQNPPTTFKFVQGPSESIPSIDDGSVDLVISAQAAHWFDWQAVWRELSRIVRPGGTVAFWGYSEMRLTRYPSLTPLITDYVQGTLGPHWEQPGRSILDDHLRRVPSANDVTPGKWADESRLYFAGPHHPHLPGPRLPVILQSHTTWGGFEAYLRTFSALHTFAQTHGDTVAEEAMQGFMSRLRAAVDAEDAKAKESDSATSPKKDEDELEIEWPVALVLAKREA